MSQRLKPRNLTRTFYLDTKRTLDEIPFANEIPQPKPQELLDLQEQNKKQRLLDSLNKIGGRLEDTSLDFIRRENFGVGTITLNKKGPYKGYYAVTKKRGGENITFRDKDKSVVEKQLKEFMDAKGLQGGAAVKTKRKVEGVSEKNLTRLREIISNKAKERGLPSPDFETYPGRGYPSNTPGNTMAKDLIRRIKKTGTRGGQDFKTVGVGSGSKALTDPLSKREQRLLQSTFPNVDFDFTKSRFGVDRKVNPRLYTQAVNLLRDNPNPATTLGFQFNKPENYLLTQFNRARLQQLADKDKGLRTVAPDYEPIYKNQKIIGFKDKTEAGAGKLYHHADYKGGASIKTHPNFEKVSKYVNIVRDTKFDHIPVLNKLFEEAGEKVPTFDQLLNKLLDSPGRGKNRISSAIEKHHTAGVKKSPEKLQLLTRDKNILAALIEGRVDSGKMDLETASRILKPEGIQIERGGVKIGAPDIDPEKQIQDLKKYVQRKTLENIAIEKSIASIACPSKAMGGRIGFQDGTSCFEKGKKMINTGNIPEGAAKRNFAKFANKAMEIGKQSGRGLRTIAKFGVLPEAIIIGADTLIRTGMGDTLNEAFLRASDFYRTDDAYEQADASELRRRDPANADIILNLRNFYNEQAKLSSLEQQKQADLALAGDDFAETNSGMTENEIEKFYAPKIQEQENNLFNASISDAEERAGLAKETEFADKKGIAYKKSILGGFLDTLAEKPGLKQAVDLFNTGTVQEPDVSAQAIDNYAPDAFKKTLQKYGPKATLDAIKRFEAEQEYPEGAVRNKNLQDEERRLLLEAAKNDPALAELYFGPRMTFAGDPIDSTDLQDEMNLDRGIYSQGGRIGYSSGSDGTALAIEESLEAFQRYLKAGGKLSYKDFIAVGGEGVSKFFNSGGRVGFKDGPKNPGRRTFMKIAAGIASIPILGKFFKPAVPLVKKLANSNTVMPDWFPNFVDKFVSRSIGKKIDADLIEYTNPDLPNVKLTRKDDGSILVEGRNEYNEPYNISYEPPGYELIDEKTGKAVKTPGNFEAVEGRHVALGPEDFDTDAFYADDLDELFTSDIAEMEKYTTGNVTNTAKDAFGRDTGLKKGMYDSDMAQGQAENRADILRDEGLDEID
jgi:hypothetical protein